MNDNSPWESWKPQGGPYDWQVRKLIQSVMALHSTFADEIWLWRGQSTREYNSVEPGMHTRVRNTPNLAFDERNVRWATGQLIEYARSSHLDEIEGMRLPDLALLAHLQHHGAATPLLDVTVDPFVALWMVIHASGQDSRADDEKDGALFGIRRPAAERWLSPLDSRTYWSGTTGDISTALRQGVHWYRAADVSERLRIQRGSFLVGPLSADEAVTFPLRWKPASNQAWLNRRLQAVGQPGKPAKALTEVVEFQVRSGMKPVLREWLQERAGLTQEVIYPTPWHRPFLEEFCRGYGRGRPIDIDSSRQ